MIEIRIGGSPLRSRRVLLAFAASAALYGAAAFARGDEGAAAGLWEIAGAITLGLAVFPVLIPALYTAYQEVTSDDEVNDS